MKKFTMITLLNYHISLYQILDSINFQLHFSIDNSNEYNCLFAIHILFWGIEISWNGRKNK